MFWPFYFIDRNLLFPVEFDEFFPLWLNNMIHTNILILSIIEMILVERKFTDLREGLRGINLLLFIYHFWLFLIKIFTGCWVYNIYGKLEGFYRILFYFFIILLANFSFFIGKLLNEFIWGKKRENLKNE